MVRSRASFPPLNQTRPLGAPGCTVRERVAGDRAARGVTRADEQAVLFRELSEVLFAGGQGRAGAHLALQRQPQWLQDAMPGGDLGVSAGGFRKAPACHPARDLRQSEPVLQAGTDPADLPVIVPGAGLRAVFPDEVHGDVNVVVARRRQTMADGDPAARSLPVGAIEARALTISWAVWVHCSSVSCPSAAWIDREQCQT